MPVFRMMGFIEIRHAGYGTRRSARRRVIKTHNRYIFGHARGLDIISGYPG
ncbi:hypothetical protein SXCC_03532 [Gluconacetobacter sp. SXCC-1]|nr:hypothetical protein SXCC_03532 [Gluconacetobacter sp. SXCC-1]